MIKGEGMGDNEVSGGPRPQGGDAGSESEEEEGRRPHCCESGVGDEH